MNNSSQPYSPGGFQVIPPAIKAIILVNITVFLLQTTPFGESVSAIGALWPIGSGNFRLWQPVTYMFLHGGGTHLFFNMFALWMFGAEIENHWGTRQFTTYYFVCGLGAAALNLLMTMGDPYPTVGASGAIYGVLLAFGMMFPDRYIFLYFLLPLKAKYFIAGYALIEFFSGLGSRAMGSGSNIAHFAHLGGMLIGFIYITIKRNEWSISGVVDKISSLAKKSSGPKSGPKLYKKNALTPPASEAEIDAILDKISAYGYASLTEKERQTLLKAGRK
ncbi:MAG: rhomboid family intramembrane serine protease [Chlorobiaceae bacterium]|nr:rhomboid family intramembrane serine protease [Chlorobiaceae bacterium]